MRGTPHWDDEAHEHMPQPRMVYISQPTELGTIYSRRELQEISEVCRRRGLYLYMDGARLGYGLCDEGNDLDRRQLPPSATPFTSAARRSAPCSGKPWCCAMMP